jgi:hypothetical protein
VAAGAACPGSGGWLMWQRMAALVTAMVARGGGAGMLPSWGEKAALVAAQGGCTAWSHACGGDGRQSSGLSHGKRDRGAHGGNGSVRSIGALTPTGLRRIFGRVQHG